MRTYIYFVVVAALVGIAGFQVGQLKADGTDYTYNKMPWRPDAEDKTHEGILPYRTYYQRVLVFDVGQEDRSDVYPDKSKYETCWVDPHDRREAVYCVEKGEHFGIHVHDGYDEKLNVREPYQNDVISPVSDIHRYWANPIETTVQVFKSPEQLINYMGWAPGWLEHLHGPWEIGQRVNVIEIETDDPDSYDRGIICIKNTSNHDPKFFGKRECFGVMDIGEGI